MLETWESRATLPYVSVPVKTGNQFSTVRRTDMLEKNCIVDFSTNCKAIRKLLLLLDPHLRWDAKVMGLVDSLHTSY